MLLYAGFIDGFVRGFLEQKSRQAIKPPLSKEYYEEILSEITNKTKNWTCLYCKRTNGYKIENCLGCGAPNLKGE